MQLERAELLRALSLLSNLVLIPIGWLTKGSDTLLWPPQALPALKNMDPHTDPHV